MEASRFELNYRKDGTKVLYGLTEIKGADAASFEIFIGGFARDKNTVIPDL